MENNIPAKTVNDIYASTTLPTVKELFPLGYRKVSNTDISTNILPFNLGRIRQDISTWRNLLLNEMENAWYQQRAGVQRLYWDVSIEGHTKACIQRRLNLTLLREYKFYNLDETENEEWTAYFKASWFSEYLRYVIEAQFYGYSLVSIPEIKDNKPKLKLIRRQNIFLGRPGDLQPYVTTVPYQLMGVPFLTGDYEPYTCWIPSPTDVGNSDVGYGLLYSVAPYAIFMRNILGSSATYVDVYGQPIRQIKTNKQQGDPEYNALYNMARDMGANAFFISDATDELIMHMPSSAGAKASPHEAFETRCKKFISGILLGHENAIVSVPGKLGSSQGGDESPEMQALKDIQAADQIFALPFINDLLLPKLRNLGINIPDGFIAPTNDDEKLKAQKRKNEINLIFFQGIQAAAMGGLEVDENDAAENTGLKITKKEVAPPPDPAFNETTKKVLQNYFS